LRGVPPKSSVLVCVFLWPNDIHNEMFPLCIGKCLSCKVVHNWVEKHGKRFADDEEVEMEVWKWLRQQPETSVLWVSKHW
jgi:hypothetical protein